MNFVDQVLHWPFVFVWLPVLAFVAVAGGLYLLARPARIFAEAVAEGPPPITTAKPKDQRGLARRQGNPVEVSVAPPADKAAPGVGSVLDRSMGGMRLAMFHEVEIGAVLSIRPAHAEEMVPWVDVEIRSCKPSKEMPGMFEIGCQYVKSPPYSIQLLFG